MYFKKTSDEPVIKSQFELSLLDAMHAVMTIFLGHTETATKNFQLFFLIKKIFNLLPHVLNFCGKMKF